MAPWRPDMQFAIQHLSTLVLNPTAESQRAVKQLIFTSKARNTLVVVLNRAEWFKKGLLELVGRVDSDWAGDSVTRQSLTGYHCSVHCVTMCNQSPEQTAISRSAREAEFYAASAVEGEFLGLGELFKDLHNNVFSVEMDSDSARHSTAQVTRETLADRKTMVGNTTLDTRNTSVGGASGHERRERAGVSVHQDCGILQISSRNIWMDRERSRSQGNLNFQSWKIRMVTT